MDFNSTCNICNIPQYVNLSLPINDISTLKVYDDCNCEYSKDKLQYAYSVDNLTWSCDMSYDDALSNTIEFNQDFFVKIKLSGIVGKVEIDGKQITDYSTSLVGCFQFDAQESSSTFNPYANMENAISLNQQLAETVSQIAGIPCYYIKLSPNQGSKDITFKEYTLMNVEAIKKVKIVIADNQMPSSKPEFSDWGLDWQTDWEVEVTKGSFATAFGNTAQPMEGDLVYIPMMKRMWMVNGAYEEKKDAFMWVATTFKLTLVKYQEKDSVDLGDAQGFVDNLVKTKYEDLFGEDNNNTYDSNEAALESPKFAGNKLYNVFTSDATRKYITCDSLDIRKNDLYFRGTLISDSMYEFLTQTMQSRIVYQQKYCGDELALSFIIKPEIATYEFENSLLKIGNVKIMIKQNISETLLYLNVNPNIKLQLTEHSWYFIIFKWNKKLNSIDAHAYRYKHNEKIPIYMLASQHYFFDIDNPSDESQSKYTDELVITEKSDIEINNFFGSITNFKLFDLYNDNISELLMMYPNHQHLMINDTARRIVDSDGVKPA